MTFGFSGEVGFIESHFFLVRQFLMAGRVRILVISPEGITHEAFWKRIILVSLRTKRRVERKIV
jgi:hypothetical protein